MNEVRVTREQMINRLREADYSFKRRAKRVEVWKKNGAVDRVNLPTRKEFTATQAGIVLTQAGLTREDIEAFLMAVAA